ncbi:hypothetical protein Ahy_A03g011828 [Arachis hypogaea]|uniref:Uncharacterized protein n=1 Tax=Arachis hypogaea TaxID=3818 RepID=A0A445DRZ2_ARAHY|nr:hypothetical protein Ahy_A03g011828 [Arachis hypogaea]
MEWSSRKFKRANKEIERKKRELHLIQEAGAQKEKIYQVIQIINKYTEASGQRINTDKSGLIFGRLVSIQRRVNIEEITGMNS